MGTYVLVHGAWGGGHNWRKVRPLLEQTGHHVYTPTLTGLGERVHLASPEVTLSTHIRDVTNAIWYEDLSDVVLVGHSYGGMVVAGVADKLADRISHLVFLDAFVPANNQSLADLRRVSDPNVSPLAASTDWVEPPPRDEDPIEPENIWYRERRHAQSRATFEERVQLSQPLSSRPFSLTYIVAAEQALPGSGFDAIAATLRADSRWTVRTVAGPHNMMRTHPTELTDLLHELFTAEVVASR
jgi:pimeloyl-ACP methyl ester carboxylesterase